MDKLLQLTYILNIFLTYPLLTVNVWLLQINIIMNYVCLDLTITNNNTG